MSPRSRFAHFVLFAATVTGCADSVAPHDAPDALDWRDAIVSPDAILPGDTGPLPPSDSGHCSGRTQGSVSISAVLSNGAVVSCDSVGPSVDAGGPTVIEGAIADVSSDGFTVDSCDPRADCVGMISRFTVRAEGLPLVALRTGQPVRVRIEARRSWGCEATLMVTNLPTWGGLPSPEGPHELLYLAAGDGTPTPPNGAPFDIARVALGCYPDAGTGCGVPEDYDLRFSDVAGASAVSVAMGTTASATFGAGDDARLFELHNARSYESGYCDDAWNYAWWVVLAPVR